MGGMGEDMGVHMVVDMGAVMVAVDMGVAGMGGIDLWG